MRSSKGIRRGLVLVIWEEKEREGHRIQVSMCAMEEKLKGQKVAFTF